MLLMTTTMTRLTASTSPARRAASGSGGDTNCGSTSPHDATKRMVPISARESQEGSQLACVENLGASRDGKGGQGGAVAGSCGRGQGGRAV